MLSNTSIAHECHSRRAIIVCICLWLLCSSSAAEYGPSLSSLTGVFVNWKGPDLLSLQSGRNIKLAQYSGYSIVIPLLTDNAQGTSEQIFQERGISTIGEFMVEAPPSYGVIAVIQELKLRKSARDRGYNSSCLDYIQFGDPKNGPAGASERICGTIHKDDMSVKPPGLIGPRTFMSHSGKIRTTFNHAYVSELVDALLQGGNPRKKATLRVEVAFTAFKTNCTDEWVNGTSGDDSSEMETFEACSDYTRLINQTCISSKLLCDDVYNCGGDGDTLGSDDQQALCPDKPMRTTEKEGEEEEQTEKPSALNSFLSMYGGSSSHTPYQFEHSRKFTPYVSPAENTPQFHPKTPRHYGHGRSSTSSTPSSTTTGSTPSSIAASAKPSAMVPTAESTAKDNVVRSAGAFSISKSSSSDINESLPKRVDITMAHDDPSYGRRELADAINSVIYGVALFIVFTIFITLFVIYIGRRIQMNLSQRNARGSMAPVVAAAVATPSIRPSTTTAVITRDNASCSNAQTRELSFSASNTTVVLVTLPQQTQNGEATYDLPPSYDTLFPTANNGRN